MPVRGIKRERGRRVQRLALRRPALLPRQRDTGTLPRPTMPTYRKKLTPEQIARRAELRKAERLRRIAKLREYAAAWKDPAQIPIMLARSAAGRKAVAMNQELRSRAIRAFLRKQPGRLTKPQWLDVLARGDLEIRGIMQQISPSSRPYLRAKSAEHLFRTMTRKGLLRLDLSTSLWENPHRAA